MSTNNLQPWGYYTGLPVEVKFDPDGRTMHLLEELRYLAPTGHEWIAPKDSVTDGASIPQAFWTVIGGPFEGKYRAAAVMHDVACVNKTSPWREVARMFYTAMRCSDVDETKAKIMFSAVYTFGPHWKPPTEPHGMEVDAQPTAPVKTLPSPKPTQADVDRTKTWVENKNPTLEQIEAQSETSLPDLPR